MYDPEDWRFSALCHKKNNEPWFPPMESDAPEQYYSIAREVCRCCSVWDKCLKDGENEKWGMWGGLTPKDRNTNKPTNVKPHGTWLRYRQGCKCKECFDAHNACTNVVDVDVSVIPYMNEPLPDLSALRFELLKRRPID